MAVSTSRWRRPKKRPVPPRRYQCCTFRGSIVAYDAASGRQIWKTFTIPDEPKPTMKNAIGTQLYGPSGAGVWSSPAVDTVRKVLYITTGDNYSAPATATSDSFMALDLETGQDPLDAADDGRRRVEHGLPPGRQGQLPG